MSSLESECDRGLSGHTRLDRKALGVRVNEQDPGSGVPSLQMSWTKPVVFEQEIRHRILFVTTAPTDMGRDDVLETQLMFVHGLFPRCPVHFGTDAVDDVHGVQ